MSHVMNDRSNRPIAFVSRTLTKAERNYCQIDNKELAIVYTIKKFHQYVCDRQFTILTHHKTLLCILPGDKGILPMTTARIQIWAILLSAYNYSLQYRPGNKNGNADFMSHFPSTNPIMKSQELVNTCI